MTLGLLSACGGSDDPPGAPAGLVATAGDGEVSLTWSAVGGADSYNLYSSTDAGVTVAGGTKTAGVTSPYVQTGLTNGLTYYYIVTAVNGDGESGASAVASATLAPDAPTGVAAVAGIGDMTVSWDAAAAVGATSYNLYWSTTPGVTTATGIKVEIADKATSTYVIPALPQGVTYYAVVTAVNAGGESPVSSEVSATLAPAAPAAVSAVSGDGEVTIAWNSDVVGATSYNLYWSNTAGVTKATGTKVEGVTTPFKHTGLTNGTTYYYVVTAVGAGGEGVESQQASAKPVVPLPNAPQNVSAIATPETTKSVTLQWTRPALPAEPAPLTYNVYRSTTPGVVPSVNTAVKLAATSPYIDLVPVGQTTYYYVVTAVDRGTEGPASAEVSATPKGPPTGGGSGETGFGNNLSVPMVFADGVGILGEAITGTDYKDLATGLRPTATDITDPFPYFNPADISTLNSVDYYRQQTSSTWQASWVNGAGSLQKVEADWGDNLASASLSASQVIRVETVLRQYKGGSSWAATESMVGYPMTLLFGEGKTEMQGTPGTAVDATERRVFAVTARLTIEKIDADGNVDTNTTRACGFDGSILEGLNMADGGQLSKYSAEINVGGSQTYGFNWRINSCTLPEKTGKWRFTFSLGDRTVGNTTVLNNTLIESKHPSETAATLDPDGKFITIEATVN